MSDTAFVAFWPGEVLGEYEVLGHGADADAARIAARRALLRRLGYDDTFRATYESADNALNRVIVLSLTSVERFPAFDAAWTRYCESASATA